MTWTKEFRVIPLRDAEMWRDCGWTIETLPIPDYGRGIWAGHGLYSVHAWRWA